MPDQTPAVGMDRKLAAIFSTNGNFHNVFKPNPVRPEPFDWAQDRLVEGRTADVQYAFSHVVEKLRCTR